MSRAASRTPNMETNPDGATRRMGLHPGEPRFVKCRATVTPPSGLALFDNRSSRGASDTMSTGTRQRRVGYGRGELKVVRNAG
jgi:hypothetical protein